jgi:putative ABC transport system substrate-binding protein
MWRGDVNELTGAAAFWPVGQSKTLAVRALLAVLLIVGSGSSDAQQQRKLTHVGVISGGSAETSKDFLDGLKQGLVEAGLVEGRDIVLHYRYAQGQLARVEGIAADLISSGSSILFTGGDQATSAAQRATKTVPIIAVTCDALAAGLVSNLARPGGNLTGVTCINADLSGKRVELLREMLPRTSKIGVTLDPSDKRMIAEFVEAERAAAVHGIKTHQILITKAQDIEPGLAGAFQSGFDGVVVVFDSLLFFHRGNLAKAAIEHRVPTIFNFRQFTEAGGLMSFGPNLREMYRQSARHFVKIIRGEPAGEIPMEQPTKFELVINLNTAKAIGLTIPESFLVRADKVIE